MPRRRRRHGNRPQGMDFVGILCYTVHKDVGYALLWRHTYTCTVSRANDSFFSELVARKAKEKNESDVDTISRVLPAACSGLLIRKLSRSDSDSPMTMNRDERIEKHSRQIRSSVMRQKGTLIISNIDGYKCYMIPVRYVKWKKLSSHLGYNRFVSTACWVRLVDLLNVTRNSDISTFHLSAVGRRLRCSLSVNFCTMISNACDRAIRPLMEELRIPCEIEERKESDHVREEEEKSSMDNLLASTSPPTEEPPHEPSIKIFCRKCRTFLTDDSKFHGHTVESCSSAIVQVSCTSIFIQEADDRFGDFQQQSGILHCPNENCKAKIGKFDWAGAQCSCRQWVFPGIQLSGGKIDVHMPIESVVDGGDVVDVVDVSHPYDGMGAGYDEALMSRERVMNPNVEVFVPYSTTTTNKTSFIVNKKKK